MSFIKFKMKGFKVNLAVIFILLAHIHSATAFFRHLCHGTLAIGRYDPLMSPGEISQHVHNVKGASNFGFDANYTTLQASNCTSCSILQDKSAYWTPHMYFRHANGTFEIVPDDGGLTAYYFTESPDTGDAITPFPPGFRMIAGNSMKRSFYGPIPDPPMSFWTSSDTTQQAVMEKSIGFNCLNYKITTPEGALQRHEMPSKDFIDTNCIDGVRAELQFPSCWDGQNLDSANHTTHVAYPPRLRNGPCPNGYPKRLPTLLYETIYQTNLFKGVPGQFVFANGDPTGNGYHGDFINGWDDGVMQQVIDNPVCTGPSASGNQWDCPIFHLKEVDAPETVTCKAEIPDTLHAEEINLVQMLPGAVPVQLGPDAAQPWVIPRSAMPTACDQQMESVQWASPSPAANNESSIPSSTAAQSYVDSTSATTPSIPVSAAPTTTASNLVTSSATNVYSTWTSITTSNGIVYNWVIVEELVTTTVNAATPTDAVKRHIQGHRHFGHNGRA